MKKVCLNCNSLLNSVFPFYLDNSEKGDYYLYKLVSPGLSEEMIPNMKLVKIGERVSGGNYSSTEKSMWSSDILSTILGTRKGVEERGVDLVEKIIEKDLGEVIGGGIEFPLIEMAYTNNRQKLLIINLRDSLRWKTYKFTGGHFIDILVSPDVFAYCSITEEGEALRLKVEGYYSTSDPERTKSLPKPEEKRAMVELLSKKWEGAKRASDMNRDIKRAEWAAFSNV